MIHLGSSYKNTTQCQCLCQREQGRERDRDRQTDRQTDRVTEREREAQDGVSLILHASLHTHRWLTCDANSENKFIDQVNIYYPITKNV